MCATIKRGLTYMPIGIKIVVLVENDYIRGDILKEHGLSFWIEYKGNRILFDTGQSDIVVDNAKKLGVDLSTANAVVLSHGHYDHCGGLSSVLNLASKAKIFLHPSASQERYSQKPTGTRFIGMSKESIEALDGRDVVWTKEPTRIFDGVFVTGGIDRVNDFEDVGGNFFLDKDCKIADDIVDDQSLFIESDDEVVVLLGCAHSGIVNTLDCISKFTKNKPIKAVIGGTHLVNASESRLEKTMEAIGKYDLSMISPLHCSGNKAVEKIRETFPDLYSYSAGGTTFSL